MAEGHGFVGISQRENGKWKAKLIHEGNWVQFGAAHLTPEDAAHAYDKGAYLARGADTQFNLPDLITEEIKAELDKFEDVYEYCAELKKEAEAKEDARYRKGSSRHRGVGWHKRDGKWRLQANTGGGQRITEWFDNEDEAGRRYDRLQISWKGRAARTNFPLQDYPTELASYDARVAAGELPAPVVKPAAVPKAKAKPARKRASAASREAAAAPNRSAAAADEVAEYGDDEGDESSGYASSSDVGDWGYAYSDGGWSNEGEEQSETDSEEEREQEEWLRDCYNVFYDSALACERFEEQYGRWPCEDFDEILLWEEENPGWVPEELQFILADWGVPPVDYGAELDDFRNKRLDVAEAKQAAAQAAVGTPDEAKAAKAADRALTAALRMEQELPTEAELVNRAVLTFVHQRLSAAEAAAAAEAALTPQQRFDRSVRQFNLDNLVPRQRDTKNTPANIMAELRRLEKDLPEYLAALATLDDPELAKSAADELVTNVLTSRRVAEVRGWDVEEQSAEAKAALRQLLGLAGVEASSDEESEGEEGEEEEEEEEEAHVSSFLPPGCEQWGEAEVTAYLCRIAAAGAAPAAKGGEGAAERRAAASGINGAFDTPAAAAVAGAGFSGFSWGAGSANGDAAEASDSAVDASPGAEGSPFAFTRAAASRMLCAMRAEEKIQAASAAAASAASGSSVGSGSAGLANQQEQEESARAYAAEAEQLEKRQAVMQGQLLKLKADLAVKEFHMKNAIRSNQFLKLCVYWEGHVAAALKAKDYGTVEKILGPDWHGRLLRAAQPGANPLFGTHHFLDSLPPICVGMGQIMGEMTGGIPNRYVSAQLAAEMGVDVEEGQSEALIPSVDEVTLQNWFMATCEQAAAGLPMTALPTAAAERQGGARRFARWMAAS